MDWVYWIHWQLLQLVTRSYFRLSIKGSEQVPTSGALLLAANHCSFLDPPLIAAAIPRQISFLAKEELFHLPFFGGWIRRLGAYPLARQKGDTQAVRTGLRLLKENQVLLVFPEGTRSWNGDLLPLQPGAAWLSLKSGAPMVPLYISGSFRACPRNSRFPRPARIQMAIGSPVRPETIEPKADRDVRIGLFNEQLLGEYIRLKEILEKKT